MINGNTAQVLIDCDEIREATIDDLPYFAQAGKEFIKTTAYTLDSDVYFENMLDYIDNPDVGLFVIGAPSGHCGIALIQSMYGKELIGRVVTTWGKGGLKCFKAAEQWAKDHGAKYLIADSLVDPRICKFYERNGMKQIDVLFSKGL